MEYSINFEKLKKDIKRENASNILIQLPDGLKKDYKTIVKNLDGDYNLFVWGGTCFGACDIPYFTKEGGIDMIIHFGHEVFKKID